MVKFNISRSDKKVGEYKEIIIARGNYIILRQYIKYVLPLLIEVVDPTN